MILDIFVWAGPKSGASMKGIRGTGRSRRETTSGKAKRQRIEQEKVKEFAEQPHREIVISLCFYLPLNCFSSPTF